MHHDSKILKIVSV